MSVFLQPIYTQTVGAGGAASVTFNNIPQGYTDLKLVISARSNVSADTWTQGYVQFNGSTGNNYSKTSFYGYNTTVGTDRITGTSVFYGLWFNGGSSTTSTFGNNEIYIPNYTSSNYKQVISDCSSENNNATALNILTAGLWSNTSSITSIALTVQAGSFVQYSTISLYGVLRQGI